MKLSNTIRDAFIRAVMADVPSVDYGVVFQDYALRVSADALPVAVRRLWNDPKTREWVATRNVFGHYNGLIAEVPGFDRDALKKLLTPERERLSALKKEQEATRNVLEQRVKAAAYSVGTRKALVEMLPEFERYLPADEAAANRQLPVVANLAADLTAAGWPKGEKKA